MLNTFDGKMRINMEGFKLYLCLRFYVFIPFSILFTAPRSPSFMSYRNRLSCPLVSGWVWPIGSLGKQSAVCEWGQGIHFESSLLIRVPWPVFFTLKLTASFKAVFLHESRPFYSNCSLSCHLDVNKPELQNHLLWFSSACQHLYE